MTFTAIDAWWWPYIFILIAGWAATDTWRFLGVFLGGQLSQDSPTLILVRCIATALVAAVIGNLIIFPSGALVGVSVWLRIAAAAAGFAAYLRMGRSILIGIVAAESVLMAGIAFS
jgi:hypothetical protein